MRAIRRASSAAAPLVAMLALASAAQAAFPGQNGRIAFTRLDVNTAKTDVYTVEPSGMAIFGVTSDGVSSMPAYSPDGTRLAFASGGALVTTDPFGNDRTTVLASPSGASDPDWSPDGDQVVISMPNCDPGFDCATDIYVVDVDGSGLTNLTNTILDERNPAWSPDGTHIAFDSTQLGETDVYVMDSDGTDAVNVTGDVTDSATEPDWSPDASRIAYGSGLFVRTANPDGTAGSGAGQGFDPAWSPDGTEIARTRDRAIRRSPPDTVVAVDPFGGIYYLEPDWQATSPPPEPATDGSGYARPKAAGPTQLALVVAYVECTDVWDNRQHGPPLAYPSCNPPTRYPDALTVGTPDTNGHPAQATGYVRLEPLPGDPSIPADEADVRLAMKQTDVRLRAPGQPDFEGSVTAHVPLRVTDKWNGGGPDGSATVIDFELRFAVPCTATADTGIGSTCSVDTTADALAPGLVPELKRSIWELGRVEVYQDRDQSTDVDDRLFLSQGVFVP
jgi:hypothetical protein